MGYGPMPNNAVSPQYQQQQAMPYQQQQPMPSQQQPMPYQQQQQQMPPAYNQFNQQMPPQQPGIGSYANPGYQMDGGAPSYNAPYVQQGQPYHGGGFSGQPGYNQPPMMQQHMQQNRPANGMQQPHVQQPMQFPMQQPMPIQVGAGLRDPGCDFNHSETISAIPKANEWSSTIFECCDPAVGGSCTHFCYGCLCTPCMLGGNHCMIKPDKECEGWLWCMCYMLGMSFYGGMLYWLCGTLNRDNIGQTYGIRSEICTNCCLHLFCGPCAVCQERREIWIRNERTAGISASHGVYQPVQTGGLPPV